MTIEELYKLARDDAAGKDARELLSQRHWFASVADFDPKTGDALPQSLDALLRKVGEPFLPVAPLTRPAVVRDRLWRIVDHSRASAERLFRALNESPRREQALLPVRAVRELNATSFIALSRRPGRNIREKLADKPYLQAVRRFQSIDLPENRLLKAFALRSKELLELRQECLKIEDELLSKIQSWLRTDEAQSIGHWNNLPPNNTLLSHRDYRRVWDAWRWLQSLDDDIKRDRENLNEHRKVVEFWSAIARLKTATNICFAEIPILFDYEKFTVNSWSTSALRLRTGNQPFAVNFGDSTKHIAATGTRPSIPRVKIETPVCIDLTSLRLRYASLRASAPSQEEFNTLPFSFVWQQWKNANETTDISLFNADAVWLHPDATTVSSLDLFFSKDKQCEHLDLAARAFAEKLHEHFTNETLFWLVPDFLNDFELEITRRNLNARFSDAEPLPRSVAAVFEKVDYSRIKDADFSVVVLDTIGGKICATKLIARFDKELPKRLPETKGFYWERCPSVILEKTNPPPPLAEISTVDANGNWHDKTPLPKPPFIDQNELRGDKRIGQFSFLLNLTESPVCGGIRLHSLQQKAGNIPLWRDHIPELSIKVRFNGRYQRFYLVEKNTTVKPIRGQAITIPIAETFTLPEKKPFYQFPLYQGADESDLGFSAKLQSTAFPLKSAVKCQLNMTFTYGADDPYRLVFEPLHGEFPPVKATWQRTEITDAPAPDYPRRMEWHDLYSWTDAQGEQINLLKWLTDSLEKLEAMSKTSRRQGRIIRRWQSKSDDQGNIYWFAFALTDNGDCYCNSKNIIDTFFDDPNNVFPVGSEVYLTEKIDKRRKKIAIDISAQSEIPLSGEQRQRLLFFKERSLQNRMALIWADAHSVQDSMCPADFKNKIEIIIPPLLNNLPSDIPQRKMMPLLACLHKDAPEECVQWINEQVKKGNIRNTRAIGFSLGDLTQEWQNKIFEFLVARPDYFGIRIFAYAIWREQHFVERFSPRELQAILNVLQKELEKVKPFLSKGDPKKDKWEKSQWRRNTAEPLELLLGLLRTRSSDNPEIKMLLQPHQKITKELAKAVEKVTDIVLNNNIWLNSRIKLNNLQKPDGDKTPDLLYALRLYLTGDDGANAIHINSVQDDETDE